MITFSQYRLSYPMVKIAPFLVAPNSSKNSGSTNKHLFPIHIKLDTDPSDLLGPLCPMILVALIFNCKISIANAFLVPQHNNRALLCFTLAIRYFGQK